MASATGRNREALRHSCRTRLLNASIQALSAGFPGLEKSGPTLFRQAHRPENSGPLSTRMLRGLPLTRANRSSLSMI